MSGVTRREFLDSRIERVAADLGTLKVARRGDLVFNKMRMWQGAVGVAPTDGLVSTDYTVAEPFPGVATAYFAELFRTSDAKNEVNRRSHGIVMDRNRLYWHDFKQILCPLPSHDEQKEILAQIGNLNEWTGRLTRHVINVIVLLREYRSALITAAVTGQIDVSKAA